jgi:hypothetical protein
VIAWGAACWYDQGGELAAGLYAVEAAGLRGAQAVEQIRRGLDYIRDKYGDGATGTDGTTPASPDA